MFPPHALLCSVSALVQVRDFLTELIDSHGAGTTAPADDAAAAGAGAGAGAAAPESRHEFARHDVPAFESSGRALWIENVSSCLSVSVLVSVCICCSVCAAADFHFHSKRIATSFHGASRTRSCCPSFKTLVTWSLAKCSLPTAGPRGWPRCASPPRSKRPQRLPARTRWSSTNARFVCALTARRSGLPGPPVATLATSPPLCVWGFAHL